MTALLPHEAPQRRLCPHSDSVQQRIWGLVCLAPDRQAYSEILPPLTDAARPLRQGTLLLSVHPHQRWVKAR